LYQFRHTRVSYTLSQKPSITFGDRWLYEKHIIHRQNEDSRVECHLIYRVTINSGGPGVALIKDFTTYLNDQPLSKNDPFDFYKKMQDVPKDWPFQIRSVGTHSFSTKDMLLPDKSHDFIILDLLIEEEDLGSIELLETLREKIRTIKTVIDYTPINDDDKVLTATYPKPSTAET
jgi:hypothetical protein